ncbi:ketopantoate reductase family protein [Methanofollis aquaemaris]|uniref:2-dehydropantoate 2-reductase n=1 Tax=Methanofollis aquaemaris TaxID=126734 RepID=A0A8A3S8Q9_9EURY|nr:ketopantoate reductase family protein [Methanofollis aquaemaris]QSZ68054.1 ketopantoate reductase family protein [Methanofollis aquaemaris]
MKVLILGAGAVGLSLAARLSDHCDVHAVCRQRHADAIAERGLVLTGLWGEGTHRFSASEEVPAGERYDYIFITSKALATRAICEQFADVIRDTETVSLQNGIGNEEIVAEYTDRVIGATIITGFEWRGDARVHISVVGGPMKLGRFPDGPDPKVDALVALVEKAGIPVEGSDHIKGDLWAKTLYNSSLNPLGALMNVPYGKLLHPMPWGIIEHVVREAYAVMAEEGVRVPWPTADDYLAYLHDVQVPSTAEHHASMLQDIMHGHLTEIDFMNGEIAARARKYELDAPYNDCITRLMHFRESLLEQ